MLTPYQQGFFDLAIEAGALCFGRFSLKSGRVSPYFFNAGLFRTGDHLARLGRAYAAAIETSGLEYDMLFGPAYKGIPLAVATCMALCEEHARNVPWAFDRKEEKDHGEGGRVVGAPLTGRVLIIDDVISSGLSVSQAARLIVGAGAKLAGICVALDRQERGAGEISARQEIEQTLGLPVICIAGVQQLLEYLRAQEGRGGQLAAIESYRLQYGV